MPRIRLSALTWRFIGALTIALTSGCVVERMVVERKMTPELQAWCKQRPPAFGSIPGDSRLDQQIRERFGDICVGLSRQDGLEFGDGTLTYACRTILPRTADPTGLRSAQAFEQAFGRRLDIGAFHAAASEPDDLRHRLYERIRATGDRQGFEHQIPIGAYSSMAGLEVTFLILANSTGQIARVLYTHADLNANVRGVRSVDGALTMLQLRELIGQPQVEFRATWTNPLCLAGDIREDSAGWTISGVPVRRECRPETLDDFHVTRSGDAILLRSRESFPKTIACH
jgi:hypothetical protein